MSQSLSRAQSSGHVASASAKTWQGAGHRAQTMSRGQASGLATPDGADRRPAKGLHRQCKPAGSGLFGEVLSLSGWEFFRNPNLMRSHAADVARGGGNRKRTHTSQLPTLRERPVTVAVTDRTPCSPSSGSNLRSPAGNTRAYSAPTLPRYCESSEHLSGKEFAKRQLDRSLCSRDSPNRSMCSRESPKVSFMEGSPTESESVDREDSFRDGASVVNGGEARPRCASAPSCVEADEEAEASMRKGLLLLRKHSLRALAVAEGASVEEAKDAAADEDAKAKLSTLICAKRRQRAEECRETIRRALINAVGGAMEAFRMIDLSGSGKISLQELSDGFDRIGVDWQEMTGFRRMLDVFMIFDRNKDGHIDYDELFPPDICKQAPPVRLSTPEYWEQWCESSATSMVDQVRGPMWEAGTPSVNLRRLYKERRKMKAASHERLTMSLLFKSLKSRGKSDAQCRECIALHLPRGTGPKDRQSVQMFSDLDVKNCRKSYQDTFQNHLKTIQREVFTMREQRVALADAKQKLFSITGPLLAAKRLDDERKNVATSVKGTLLFNHAHDGWEDTVEDGAGSEEDSEDASEEWAST